MVFVVFVYIFGLSENRILILVFVRVCVYKKTKKSLTHIIYFYQNSIGIFYFNHPLNSLGLAVQLLAYLFFFL